MRSLRRLVTPVLCAGMLVLGSIGLMTQSAGAAPAANHLIAVSPYYANGWGAPPVPKTVMTVSGVRWFSMAFMLSNGGCTPLWDGNRALTGGGDAAKIAAIRAAGGDVIVSFGGAQGYKLGRQCSTAASLAAAYQKVISTYHLKGIDVDIELAEFHDNTAVQREIDALKIVQQKNHGIKVFITFPSLKTGPDSWGVSLIKRCSLSHLWITAWVIMPFDMGGGSNMGADTVRATDGLHAVLENWYGLTSAQAYHVSGISSMNGKTDENEIVDRADFRAIVNYANLHHLGRLAFWSMNRDRQCYGGPADSCSGIAQNTWDFTTILARFRG